MLDGPPDNSELCRAHAERGSIARVGKSNSKRGTQRGTWDPPATEKLYLESTNRTKIIHQPERKYGFNIVWFYQIIPEIIIPRVNQNLQRLMINYYGSTLNQDFSQAKPKLYLE